MTLNSTRLLGSTTVCYPLSVDPAFTLERALEGIAGAGLQYVELAAIPGYCPHLEPEKMDREEVAAVETLLQRHGLQVSAINVTADLTTEDGVQLLGHTMRISQDLGVDTVVTHVEHTEAEGGEARFRVLLPDILSLAQRYGTTVALETHGGLVTTGAQGLALLKEVDSEYLKMTYDMANVVYYGGVLPEEDLRQMGDHIGAYIAHVHLKDKANMTLREYNFPPFGEGILDFGTVLQLLDEGGYRGHMSLEVELDGAPESPELVDESLASSYDYLQRVQGVRQ